MTIRYSGGRAGGGPQQAIVGDLTVTISNLVDVDTSSLTPAVTYNVFPLAQTQANGYPPLFDNDTGITNQNATYWITAQDPLDGVFTFYDGGAFSYDPLTTTAGTASFTYQILDYDGLGSNTQADVTVNVGDNIIPLNLNLSTAGRLGFYMDYSELTAAGTHRFWVARTHGTTGAVSVDYATAGDTHTSVSGTLNWADGDASIQAIDVPVSGSDLSAHDLVGLGEHRILITLSNPTNGAALHFDQWTTAHGVIDRDTIASDANAIFVDSDAVSNGNGTQASPYNNIYDAISNLGVQRYIYGKGTETVDGTNSGAIYSQSFKCIFPPASRAGESTRLYIRNWPGETWEITGGGDNDVVGFLAADNANGADKSYHTYKGITFTNFDTTASSGQPCGAIWYHYGDYSGIHVEHCTVDGISGRENQGGFNFYGCDSAKVWRSSVTNVDNNGDQTNHNTGGVFSYQGARISVQRCTFNNAHNGIYHKGPDLSGDAGTTARFNYFGSGLLTAFDGGPFLTDYGHFYTAFQNNVCAIPIQRAMVEMLGDSTTNYGRKTVISNNVFYPGIAATTGVDGLIHFRKQFTTQIYNNIFGECRVAWGEGDDDAGTDESVEYADYNHVENTTYRYARYRSTYYSSLSNLQASTPYGDNDVEGDPLFTDAANGDFTLQVGSPCVGTGVSGTDKGVYLTGTEVIGA